jgi:hypothetical protein
LARAHRRNSRSISSSRPIQWGQCRSAQCLKTARNVALTQHLPSAHRPGDAPYLDDAEVAVVEEIADQPTGARGDDNSVRLGQALQTGGDVRRFAND